MITFTDKTRHNDEARQDCIIAFLQSIVYRPQAQRTTKRFILSAATGGSVEKSPRALHIVHRSANSNPGRYISESSFVETGRILSFGTCYQFIFFFITTLACEHDLEEEEEQGRVLRP